MGEALQDAFHLFLRTVTHNHPGTSLNSAALTMGAQPPPNALIKRIGLREVYEDSGRHFQRRIGTEKWTEFHPQLADIPSAAAEDPLYISLVREKQGEGEPNHWSIFVHRENQDGWLYQVTGDAECMQYAHSPEPVNILNSEAFLDIYNLATVGEEEVITLREIVDSEPPPRAESRALVTENCQGWAVRVISRLAERGVVQEKKLEMARSMLEPV